MARRLAIPALIATLAAALSVWSQMTGLAWTDYDSEAAGPLASLLDGHVGTFLATAPAYGGSLVMRAPFAFVPSLWGGEEEAVYRLMAVPCLLAVMVLGVVLFELRARRFAAARWSLVIVVLAAGNPVSLRALEIGHPEELLGAALCAGAVLAAVLRRPWLAAVLLGFALANKAWAVLAIGPVLLALEHRRVATLSLAAAIAACLYAPCLIAGHLASDGHGIAALTQTSAIFQPWQVWWPLGDLDHVVRGIDGTVKVDYRYPPAWLGPVTHPLIALTVIPASFAWWRRRGTGPTLDLLLLLAMLLLLRCVLDPWDIGYYHVAFLMALLAWEALRYGRPPVLSLAAAALIWISFEKLPQLASPDVQCLAYLGWALPALGWMAWSVYRLPLLARRRAAVPAIVTH